MISRLLSRGWLQKKSVACSRWERPYMLRVLSIAVALLGPLFVGAAAYAISTSGLYEGTSYGPNHQYVSDNVSMEYVVSADTYTDIYATRLNIYLDSMAPVTVRVYGADVCSKEVNNTHDSIYNRSMSLGTYLGAYMLRNAAGTSDRQQFYYRDCGTSNFVDLSLSPSADDFDAQLNMYVLSFTAAVTDSVKGKSTFLNGFRVQVTSDRSAIIGQASSADGVSAKDFGMQVGVPRDSSTYADFYMPFSTDCSITEDGTTTKAIEVYDADYGDSAIQPGAFYIGLQGRRFGSSAWTFIPPLSSSQKLARHSSTEYYSTAKSKETSTYVFSVNKNYEYRMYVTHLFNNNTMQFSLPFPAIAKQRSCSPAWVSGQRITDAKTDGSDPVISGLNVSVSGSGSTTDQPFNFKNIIVPNTGATKTVSIEQPALSSGWEQVGYAICNTRDADCTPANLQYKGRYYKDETKASIPVFLKPGQHYDMRWIFAKSQPVACLYGSTLFSPALIDKGTKFTINPSVRVRGTPTNPKITATISGPGFSFRGIADAKQVGASNVYQASFGPLGPTTQAYQTYALNWTYTDGANTKDCTRSFDVVKKPTFSVLAGDLYSGSSVMAWNNDIDDKLFGSHSNYAVLAGSKVFGFPSALNAQVARHKGNELTFANIGSFSAADGAKGYGGDFDAVPAFGGMISDADASNTYQSRPTLALGDIPSSGKYKVKDGVRISGTLGRGIKATLISDGSIVVEGDVEYAGAAYESQSDIPRLNVYAGNIIVLGSVRSIKGLYVAESNFYTCGYQKTVTEYAGYEYADFNTAGDVIRRDCDGALQVEGSVQAAGDLVLTRFGGEGYYTGINGASADAETFAETPEFWMAQSAETTTNALKYDYYVGLPPVL